MAFVVIISLPFTYFGETELKEYLWKSKILGANIDDLASPKFFNSIFWKFLTEEVYFNKYCLAIPSKVALLVTNIWFFFVKKNCLPTCIDNLMNTLSKTPSGVDSFEKKRLTIEVLIIQYFVGCVIMPGAHTQF